GGRAVAGEVLRAGAEAGLAQSRADGLRVAGHQVRVVAEGARADDGVRGIGGDVEHRGQVEVQVAGGEQIAQGAAHRAAQLDVVDLPQRPRGGQGGAGPRLQPGDVTALLVDRDHAVP